MTPIRMIHEMAKWGANSTEICMATQRKRSKKSAISSQTETRRPRSAFGHAVTGCWIAAAQSPESYPARALRTAFSTSQSFEQRRRVNLVGLVVAGQRIHHHVDAEA